MQFGLPPTIRLQLLLTVRQDNSSQRTVHGRNLERDMIVLLRLYEYHCHLNPASYSAIGDWLTIGYRLPNGDVDMK